MEKELLEKLKTLSTKGISLSKLCKSLKLNEYEILALTRELKNEGLNIISKKFDDDIYIINQGEVGIKDDLTLNTNNEDFKFVAISDTRFGSKDQQLSILNDIYLKAYKLGYPNVLHCGNISEGIYPISNIYADTTFINNTQDQINYIVNNYPKVDSINTYFITGNKDEKHLISNKINIGKRINALRSDMIYLGNNSCTININNAKILIISSKLSKTYTVSYRTQQQIDSIRSEDKPDILLYGGLLQMEKFVYRNIFCLSIPSVCATTKEMSDKRYSNTIAAWYITLKFNLKGKVSLIKALNSVYYVSNKQDYNKSKVLRIKKD